MNIKRLAVFKELQITFCNSYRDVDVAELQVLCCSLIHLKLGIQTPIRFPDCNKSGCTGLYQFTREQNHVEKGKKVENNLKRLF